MRCALLQPEEHRRRSVRWRGRRRNMGGLWERKNEAACPFRRSVAPANLPSKKQRIHDTCLRHHEM